MAAEAGYEAIVVSVEDHVATLTLNRPEAMNAFNAQLQREFIEACASFNADPDIRVVIITGAGEKAFSAGLDLKERAAEQVSFIEKRAGRVRPGIATMHRALAAVDRPTIAAIHGWCLGGGLEIALACDLRIAATDSKIGLVEIRRGLMPGAGGSQRLARIVGRGHALKMTLTGEPIDAAEAYRIGLVNEVVEPAELLAAAGRLAATINKGAPVSARFIKEAINKGLDLSLEEGLRLEADLAILLGQTEDSREGPRSFVEKRPPVWHGK
jgi:enoyl-CoA hydratase/carnithine racemase